MLACIHFHNLLHEKPCLWFPGFLFSLCATLYPSRGKLVPPSSLHPVSRPLVSSPQAPQHSSLQSLGGGEGLDSRLLQCAEDDFKN